MAEVQAEERGVLEAITPEDKETRRRVDRLTRVVERLSFKTSVYATLFGLLNVHKTEFGAEVVKRVMERLSKRLKELATKPAPLVVSASGARLCTCV